MFTVGYDMGRSCWWAEKIHAASLHQIIRGRHRPQQASRRRWLAWQGTAAADSNVRRHYPTPAGLQVCNSLQHENKTRNLAHICELLEGSLLEACLLPQLRGQEAVSVLQGVEGGLQTGGASVSDRRMMAATIVPLPLSHSGSRR